MTTTVPGLFESIQNTGPLCPTNVHNKHKCVVLHTLAYKGNITDIMFVIQEQEDWLMSADQHFVADCSEIKFRSPLNISLVSKMYPKVLFGNLNCSRIGNNSPGIYLQD